MSNDVPPNTGADAGRRKRGVIEGILSEAREDRDSREERVAAVDAGLLRRQRRGSTARRWLIALLPVLVLLTVGNVMLARRVPDLFTAEDEEAMARFDIYLAATAIAAYEAVHEEPPASLEEAGLDLPQLTYETQGAGYRLIARAGLRRIIYRQGEDLSTYAPQTDAEQALVMEETQPVERNQ